MTRPLLLTALLLAAAPLAAQQGTPGLHFVENWDLDGDGAVTLAEATERRGDVFRSFDADDDGVLSPEEHDLFDQARAQDMETNGMGHGGGARNPANGMLRAVTDVNGDGQVTRDEFLNTVPEWFTGMDRNGDGVITPDDFGGGMGRKG